MIDLRRLIGIGLMAMCMFGWSGPVWSIAPDLPPSTAGAPTSAVSWLRPSTLSWATSLDDASLRRLNLHLLSSADGSMLSGGKPDRSFALHFAGHITPASELGRSYPWLIGQALLRLDGEPPLDELIRTQLLLRASDKGQHIAEEGIQLAPLLDLLMADDGPLGIRFHTYQPEFRLWAPTARNVQLLLFDKDAREVIQRLPMTRGAHGVWSLMGHSAWYGGYYQYEVQVYSSEAGEMVTHAVTDPYSVTLAADSSHSQIVSLRDPMLMPRGWQRMLPLQPEAPEDMVIYELQLRDFSAEDGSLPEADRGKYTAFTHAGSNGMRHLRGLAAAGLTHVHLLPVFDIASIEEKSEQQAHPRIPAAPPDSDEQQAAIGATRTQDAYNWGYDPWHYGAPEGSYSSNPQGWQRVLEFREMVQGLQKAGLGTILDVVYNHTAAAGIDTQSVLDKIVPGYYHRLDSEGRLQQSTCCPDTASEHKMMEKLMIDTLVRWARDYKITGFRFDLMGHHTLDNLRHIRQALDALTPGADGIDGKKIYLYGEGWKFGSLDARQPTQAMNQVNGAGLGVGMFNDRLRDSARGGNFDHATRADQGWLSGLYLDPNQSVWDTDTPVQAEAQKALLLNYTYNLCLGMAGGLRDFLFTGPDGRPLKGADLSYRGQPGAGFASDPQESISYVSAHDNYSLWDQIAAKAPYQVAGRQPETATPRERMEMQLLGISTVLLGQGVPFLDAGVEMLRSKSGDGDSYDSGDWFNALDWTYHDNGWGKGLPPAWRNEKEWDFWRPRLSDPHFIAGRNEILNALAQVQRLLRVRKATPLLRLRSAEEIRTRIRFLNAEKGPEQSPGLIAMYVDDPALAPLPRQSRRIRNPGDLDPARAKLLVLLNPAPVPVRFTHPLLADNWRPFHEGNVVPLQMEVPLDVEGQPLTMPPLALSKAGFSSGEVRLPAHGVVVLQVDQ